MTWISKNNYLTLEEMQNNAKLVWEYFHAKGWTINAVSAMLGNMQSESNINPGIWENLTVDPLNGYGLVQWTPSTKYIEWAGGGYESGYKQCERIQYEADNGIQWFRNPQAPIVEPPLTFKEFTTSTLEVEVLANYFLWYYEHPTETIQGNRGKQAKNWYDFIIRELGVPVTPKKTKSMPLYMMIRPSELW